MMTSQENPWVDRFAPLLSREDVRKRSEARPKRIVVPDEVTVSSASDVIDRALQGLFYPTEQRLDILCEWVGLAYAHSLTHYRCQRAFIEGVYGPNAPLPEFFFPLCLTGLAGTGKSALLKAFARVAPPHGKVPLEDGVVVPLEAFQILTVHASNTPKDMLVQLSQLKGSLRSLVDTTRRLAYRNGWSAICLDEFQFVTQSDKANTRIVQMLMSLCYLGIPAIYIANFSLLHKLMARNQEDIHRLLGKVQLLAPESHSSHDWHMLLQWQRDVAPDVFAFDPVTDAQAIHFLTAGVNRAVAKLLKIAFVRACLSGRPVKLAELEAAQKTDEYSIFRRDVELLQQISVQPSRGRKDLQCPLDLRSNVEVADEWRQQRQQRVDEAAVDAALTEDERSILTNLRKVTKASTPRPQKATVVPITKAMSLAEQLKENLAWYEDKY
jgi:hypothetical protein